MHIHALKDPSRNHLDTEIVEIDIQGIYPSNVRTTEVREQWMSGVTRVQGDIVGSGYLIDIVSRDTGLVKAVAFYETMDEVRNLYKESWHGDN